MGEIEPLLGQRPPVHLRPGCLTSELAIMPLQEAAHRLLGPDGIVLRISSSANGIVYRLMRFVRHPDRGKFVGAYVMPL